MSTQPVSSKSRTCDKVNICGVEIDCVSFDQAAEIILAHAASRQSTPGYVVTPNAQHILLLRGDTRFRESYQEALLIVPDGISLLWAASLLGTPLRGRVNGTDLFEHLCSLAARDSLRVYLLGGRRGAAERAAQVLQARHPELAIAGTDCPPFGFEKDAREMALIGERITKAAPDMLFVGLGTPKQEYWIHENYRRLGVPMSIGIGASIDFVSGMVRRAPVWMQKSGGEWLFRLFVEPRRLWKRYLIGNPQFMYQVLRQRLGLLKCD